MSIAYACLLDRHLAIVISICQSNYKYLTGIYSYLTEWFYVFNKVVMLTHGCFTGLCLCWSVRGRTDSWLLLYALVEEVTCVCQSGYMYLSK